RLRGGANGYCGDASPWARPDGLSRGASGFYAPAGAPDVSNIRSVRQKAARGTLFQSTPRRLDDARLGRLVEIRVHRQTDDLAGELVADRQPAAAERILPVGDLPVQRDRVIDRGRDAVGLERGGERVAAATGDADGVLRPDRGQARRNRRHGRDVAQALGVAPGDHLPGLDLLGEYLELLAQHRGLDGIEPRGQPDADIVVFVAALTVHPEAAQRVGDAIVVGQHRAAVAVAAERLGREEAGAGHLPECA